MCRPTLPGVIRVTGEPPTTHKSRGPVHYLVLGPLQDEDAAEVRKILEEGRAAKDPDRSCIWAGGGVGLIDSIESVGDVLSGIENAMVQAKERVVRMFAS